MVEAARRIIAAAIAIIMGMTSVPGGTCVTPSWTATNSWGEGDQRFTQYEWALEATDADITGWELHGKADGPVEVTQSWNCTVTQDGNALTIAPADYNAAASRGETIRGGLIVKGAPLELSSYRADTAQGSVGGGAGPAVVPTPTP